MTAPNLRTALDATGLSAASLARLTGYRPQTVRLWLMGRSPAPPDIAAWLTRRLADMARDPPPGR